MTERPGPAAGPIPERPLGLWEGYGIELETMIVDEESLDVRPVADRLFERMGWTPSDPDGDAGGPGESTAAASDLEVEGVGWSNEVALHVLELKTPGPAPGLEGLASVFQRSVERANRALEALGCRLLPGGAHPWMDPVGEFRIWPHEYNDVYRAFDRIFSCRGHGWANVQSTHVNLPFSGDEEFGRLHEAVRVVLPLIPAVAASSPILEGRVGPALDNRLVAYRDNSRRVPSVVGAVIPEPAGSEAEYGERILEPIYRDLAPLDPGGTLRHEWVNSRGAIARFARGSVEIRLIDAQECPRMDLAVASAVVAAVRRAAAGLEAEPDLAADASSEELSCLLDRVVRSGRATTLEPAEGRMYARALGLPGRPATAGEAWHGLLEETLPAGDGAGDPPAGEWSEPLRVLLEGGTLAERILADLGLGWPGAAGELVDRSRLVATYRRLADALARGEIFRG